MSNPITLFADGLTAEAVAAHLNHEPDFPPAEDLDVHLVKQWIAASHLNLRKKQAKRLAPEVLEELRAMDGITAEDAARHQQRYPVKHDAPKPMYTWNGDGSLCTRREIPSKDLNKQPSAWKVVGDKRATKYGKEANLNERDVDETGGVKLDDTSDQEETEQAVDKAIAEATANAKKAKKAAKRARKTRKALEKALKEAKPPVGPKEDDSEDSGNDSDWTQTSWSPSWASDSEEHE
ncbi:hypothetical protein E4T50_10506 [Aureobasidium sp. EXF-12298]|nr:hypothetical protein E4T50_10506 [Aureobasidium sp. EXF-12298]